MDIEMGKREWTEEQLSAIETRDRTLLVSAAAGSGKTATLTERIIRSLTDENDPADIDKLLVVTFTNAAAAELREKLSAALSEALSHSPENARLKRALYLLPAAKIRTIDSFCSEVLRQNADRVGVSPSYRIADTAECELISSSVANSLIDAAYRGELPEIASVEEFDALADCLTDSGRSDELADVFRFVRERCDSLEDGVPALLPLIKKYDPECFTSVEESADGKYIIARVREAAEHYKRVLEGQRASLLEPCTEFCDSVTAAGDGLSCGPTDGEIRYADMLSSDIKLLGGLCTLSTYDEYKALFDELKFVTRPSLRADKKTEKTEKTALLRDMMKKDISAFSSYFVYTSEMWRELYSSLYSSLSVLYRFVLKFDEVFLNQKRRAGALSYADVERYTYKCLVGRDGEPTDIAINLRNRFSAVYIDEYQDVNSLQNAIFAAISRENNRFMVGDIKQSIYGFRSAEPEIFAKMKAAFPPLSDEYTDEASVFMSKNFRCDKGIVDFVNSVFDRVFSRVGDSIGYSDGDKLGYAKRHEFDEPEYRSPEICLIPRSSPSVFEEDEEEKEEPVAPRVVAAKICELLRSGVLDNGERIKPSDIAIILRFAKGKDHKYAEALEELGIPSAISGSGRFFLSPEILLVLCLLNTIDNPRRDIYLAGLLLSPLFDFSADELALIRRASSSGSLYESIVDYSVGHPEDAKLSHFLSRLSYYREVSEGMCVDALLDKLYRETGLLALAEKKGGGDNLLLLYNYARGFSVGSFSGLYNFISFINSLIDKKTEFDDNRESESKDAVKIITCHSSKGLEYPVVFLVECGTKITNRDKSSRLAFSSDFGLAFRLRSEGGVALADNPARDITNHYIYRKLFEEELRILYVALTRARERLYIVGSADTKDIDEYKKRLSLLCETLSPYSVRTLSSPMEIMLASSRREFLSPEEFVSGFEKTAANEQKMQTNDIILGKEEAGAPLSSEELLKRLSYKYPRVEMTKLPEKMSVSKTSPDILDGADEGTFVRSFSDADSEEKRHLPAFFEGRSSEESAKRGIATHYVLQFCDLNSLKEKGAEAEIERLFNEGYISLEDKNRVRVDEIEVFRSSKLFSDMLSAKNLYRELRFNTLLSASLFTEDEDKRKALAGEKILVQGVIDCVVEYENGDIGLFDYKTDRLKKEELENRCAAEERLRASHKTQLSFYAKAAEEIFGKAPKTLAVYSLHLGEIVDM